MPTSMLSIESTISHATDSLSVINQLSIVCPKQSTHPHSTIYNTLAGLMKDFEGLYLESDPCFICNNIESPIVNLK